MSAYRPAPGLGNSSASSTSLPARPPPAAASPRGFKPAFQSSVSSNTSSNARSGSSGFTGFAPRAVAVSNKPYRTTSPVVSAGPQPPPGFSSQSAYGANSHQQAYQQQGYYPQSYNDTYAQQTPPQIRNPFAPPTTATSGVGAGGNSGGYGNPTSYDPEMEAQIAQWQSAYMPKDDSKVTQKNASQTAVGSVTTTAAAAASRAPVDTKAPASTDGKPLTVQRSGGGQKWNDNTLLEWDPAHFRIFVGNLAGEVTDDSLLKAFAKYPSVQKARVIRDKLTTKSRGYGFVSFSDGDDYFKAARDMQNKYIGSHPVKIKKSTTEIKPVSQKSYTRQNNQRGAKTNGRGAEHSSNGILGPTSGGVIKKQSKTKGGLKILG